MLILITGHEGFIGRNLASHYRCQGDTVIGVDLKNGDDCRDFFRANTTACRQFDLVVHCATGGGAELINWVAATHQPKVVYFAPRGAYVLHEVPT